MAEGPARYKGIDGDWHLSETPPAHGWVRRGDQWYPGPAAREGPARWLSVDGDWHLSETPPAEGWVRRGDQWYPPAPKGAPKPQPRWSVWFDAQSTRRRLAIILGVLGVLVVVGVVLTQLGANTGGSSGSSHQDDDVTRSLAFDACKNAVKERLRSPASAQFPDYFDHDAEATVTGGDGTYTVDSHVDSQNGFGAVLTTPFECTVTDNGQGSWNLDNLDMQGQ